MDEQQEIARFLDEGCPQDPVGTSQEDVNRCRYCGIPIKDDERDICYRTVCINNWFDRLFNG